MVAFPSLDGQGLKQTHRNGNYVLFFCPAGTCTMPLATPIPTGLMSISPQFKRLSVRLSMLAELCMAVPTRSFNV